MLLLYAIIIAAGICTGQGLKVKGLRQPVEIIRDRYGINHIYAGNEHDLFFAQGYCAAKDRLFQFEIWRRQATGTVAEILGERELNRDTGARLFKFRGNLMLEYNHYHPRGQQIIAAFTEGVNSYIRESLRNKDSLPLEFRLLGIEPGLWTPEVVISRHQGLLQNINKEILNAKRVAVLGAEKVRELDIFEPGSSVLDIDPAIKVELIPDNVIAIYNAFRNPLVFTPGDILITSGNEAKVFRTSESDHIARVSPQSDATEEGEGSNNWIISGELSQNGYPMLANDPHRVITTPSLRYMVHLNAPGWNVLGAGEPEIPGVSIGHNDYGAWGLTAFYNDVEDLYVYELNPKNSNQYLYEGKWEEMLLIKDTIKVKSSPDVIVEHRYTRHGPVTYIDTKNKIAYAMRCAWLETGCSPYLSGLRIDQAKTWEEFRKACAFCLIPGLNMVWADKNGDIGWQVSSIAPIRRNWSGLVPVPGDGLYEWSGYLPVIKLPNVLNPARGYWVTANQNLTPPHYEYTSAIGREFSDTYRSDRISEVLGSGKKHSLADMMSLQTDYLSIPARTLVPLLKDLKSDDMRTEAARTLLLGWNYVLDKESSSAGIYVAWERIISQKILSYFVPKEANDLYKSIPMRKVISWIINARPEFGENAIEGRNRFLLDCLQQAVNELTIKLGTDMRQWIYGQVLYHHILIKHPLSDAVSEQIKKKLEFGPVPRGGNSYTPNVTGNTDNQAHGASFRFIADTRDWDLSMFTITPGQSGDPQSQFYGNLFGLWAVDRYFPVYFSRKLVEKATFEKTVLSP